MGCCFSLRLASAGYYPNSQVVLAISAPTGPLYSIRAAPQPRVAYTSA